MPEPGHRSVVGPEAGVLGVGVDLEQRGRFLHLDPSVVQRAAARWLSPGERRWCTTQACYREAMLVVLSCKEAVYKTRASIGGLFEAPLAMRGSTAFGRATITRFAPVRVDAAWQCSGDDILAVAVAGHGDETGELLEHLLRAIPQDLARSHRLEARPTGGTGRLEERSILRVLCAKPPDLDPAPCRS